MPSLGSFDALRQEEASIEDINQAKDKAESLVPTSQGILQYDILSKRRMELVLSTLKEGDSIDWKMANNTSVTLDKPGLISLMSEADVAAVIRLKKVFEYAKTLKDKKKKGEVVTRRDISIERW